MKPPKIISGKNANECCAVVMSINTPGTSLFIRAMFLMQINDKTGERESS